MADEIRRLTNKRGTSSGQATNSKQHSPIRTVCGIRICGQKFGTLVPKDIRTCLEKQTGSFMWITGKLR